MFNLIVTISSVLGCLLLEQLFLTLCWELGMAEGVCMHVETSFCFLDPKPLPYGDMQLV